MTIKTLDQIKEQVAAKLAAEYAANRRKRSRWAESHMYQHLMYLGYGRQYSEGFCQGYHDWDNNVEPELNRDELCSERSTSRYNQGYREGWSCAAMELEGYN